MTNSQITIIAAVQTSSHDPLLPFPAQRTIETSTHPCISSPWCASQGYDARPNTVVQLLFTREPRLPLILHRKRRTQRPAGKKPVERGCPNVPMKPEDDCFPNTN